MGLPMRGVHFSFFTHRDVAIIFLLSLFLCVVDSGCNSTGHNKEEGSLESRVKTFWEVRIAGEDIKAYDFEEYSKKGSMSLEQYIRARNPALRYKTYKIKEVEENGDNAIVKLDVGYNLSLPTRGQFNMTTEITDRWVRLDGQWYRQETKKKEKKTPAP